MKTEITLSKYMWNQSQTWWYVVTFSVFGQFKITLQQYSRGNVAFDPKQIATESFSAALT